ncbi:MAG: hypothetical protein AAGE43_10110, partial [Pseudomonadota bacterium]
LVDAGTPIREAAGLDMATLRELGGDALGRQGVEPVIAQVGVIGDTLPMLLQQNQAYMPKLRFTELNTDSTGTDVPLLDTVVVEVAGLDEATLEMVEALKAQCGVDCVVVVYGYARQALALEASSPSTACLRAPVNYRELQRTTLALIGEVTHTDTTAAAPAPRYSKQVLARVAALPETLVCECPRHIAELIFALGDFEAYSATCESRDDKDALIHAYLKETAAHARAAFEDALGTVARHENIPVEDWQQAEG